MEICDRCERDDSDENAGPSQQVGEHPPVISSEQLFGEGREIWIEHRGDVYRLRHTLRGKLYLTKRFGV